MSARCPLCGGPIAPISHCVVCPLAGACQVQCCPRCGYQTVDETRSAAARLVRRLFGAFASHHPVDEAAAGPGVRRSLADLLPGEEAEISALGDMPESRLLRLTALGLLPGDRVRLVQRQPVPVIRIDETEVALGSDIHSQIYVGVAGPRSEALPAR
ncbi:MAG TPA: FeoA domain-containing protein [Chloroflexota bacterium]|nr:FeoA domain-containing protein [Chloroflexota bacterium]